MRDEIKVRRIGAGGWPEFRQLRLWALDEAPYAFTLRRADWHGPGDTEARWRARLSDVPLNLIAEWQGNGAGMVSGTPLNSDGAKR